MNTIFGCTDTNVFLLSAAAPVLAGRPVLSNILSNAFGLINFKHKTTRPF